MDSDEESVYCVYCNKTCKNNRGLQQHRVSNPKCRYLAEEGRQNNRRQKSIEDYSQRHVVCSSPQSHQSSFDLNSPQESCRSKKLKSDICFQDNIPDAYENVYSEEDNSSLSGESFTGSPSITHDSTEFFTNSHIEKCSNIHIQHIEDVHSFHLNPTEGYLSQSISMVRLISCFRDAKAPKYLFDQVMDILKDEFNKGRANISQIGRLDTFMEKLRQKHIDLYPKYVQIQMMGSSYEKKHGLFPKSPLIPVFPFSENLQSLLNDSSIFSSLENLIVDRTQRWNNIADFIPASSMPTSIHHGAWRRAYNNSFLHNPSILETGHHFRLDLCLYTDKTGVDAYSRHGLEPVVFSLTILNETVRNRPDSWRHMLFVPTLYKESASKLRKISTGGTRHHPLANYHMTLLVALEEMIRLQKFPEQFNIQLGDEWVTIPVLLQLNCFIGDAKSNDVLCCRIQSRRDTTRLCRGCLVSSDNADGHLHVCRWIDQSITERLALSAIGPSSDAPTFHSNYPQASPETQSLWQKFLEGKKDREKYRTSLKRRQMIAKHILQILFGCHPVDSAFHHINMGCNPRGITGATPTDCMHAVESGIIPMIMSVVLDPMTDTDKTELDDLVGRLFTKKNNTCHGKNAFPRTNFVDGFCSLTKLSAKYRVGRLFTLCFLAQFKEGKEILIRRLDPSFDQKRKDRANMFKGIPSDVVESSDEELSDEDNEIGDEQESEDVAMPTNTQKDYTGSREQLVHIQNCLGNLGLKYSLPIILSFSRRRRRKVFESIWKCVHASSTYQKNIAYEDYPIPESRWSYGDTESAFSGCADLRTEILSYIDPEEETIPLKKLDTIDTDDLLNSDSDCSTQKEESDESNCISSDDDRRREIQTSIRCRDIDSLMRLLQHLLSFHFFYSHWKTTQFSDNLKPNIADCETNLRRMIRKIVRYIQRGEGTYGWKISKLHDLLHIFVDVENFGPSSGVDASIGERGLKTWAKEASKNTQKHTQDAHLRQVSRNVVDSQVLSEISQVYGIDDYVLQKKRMQDRLRSGGLDGSYCLRVPLYWVRMLGDGDHDYRVNSSLRRHHDQTNAIHPSIRDFLQTLDNKDLQLEEDGEGVIVYSELHLNDDEKTIFRAHPNFRSEGAWYDWAMIKYWDDDESNETDNDDKSDETDKSVRVPVKILGFLHNKNDKDDPYVIIHPCRFQTEKEKEISNGIFSHWTIDYKTVDTNNGKKKKHYAEPAFALENASFINGHVYAVEADPLLFVRRYLKAPWKTGYSLYNGEFKVVVAKDQFDSWTRYYLYQNLSHERRMKARKRYKRHLNCNTSY